MQKNKNDLLAKPESFECFFNKEIPERKPLVKELINQEELHVFSGTAKLGKSLLKLHLALCLASGQKFLNFKIPEPVKILIVQQEVAAYFFRIRAESMIVEFLGGVDNPNDISEKIKQNVYHWSHRGFHIDNHNHLNQLKFWIEEINPSVIFFDPLCLLHTKDENSAKEMSRLMELFHALISTYKLTIFLIHHTGKANNYTGGDLHRGSSVIQGATDGNWILQKQARGGNKLNITFELRNQKAISDITISREPDSLLFSLIHKESLIKTAIEEIVNLVNTHGEIAQKELIEKLKAEDKASERTLWDALKTAKDKNHIDTVKVGREIMLLKK